MIMNPKDRAKKDLDKLDNAMRAFDEAGLAKKYPVIIEYVENYCTDAKHFYEKGEYFTAFGAANYAYGFIDAILLIEGKKDEQTF